MSYFKDVQLALDTRLSTVTGALPTAWENVPFTPVEGTAFMRPTVLMGPADLLEISNRTQSNDGIYQVDLYYPTGQGNASMLDMMDAISNHFRAVDSLTSGAVTVHLQQISRTSPVEAEDGWVSASISIAFQVYE